VYRKIIAQKFGNRRVRIYGHDWRQLPDEFGQFFDTTLVLGNSICLVTTVEQQRRVMAAFYEITRSGGRIIIDERNFAHFTGDIEVQRITHNPVRFFPYHDRVMYCGDEIRAYPKSISSSDVTFSYYTSDHRFDARLHAADDLDADLEADLVKREVGVLHMYPFRKGELAQLLMDAGFNQVTVYGDLDFSAPKSVAHDPDWYSADADFLTYVARKPVDALSESEKEHVHPGAATSAASNESESGVA
jgi:hypothetical protein